MKNRLSDYFNIPTEPTSPVRCVITVVVMEDGTYYSFIPDELEDPEAVTILKNVIEDIEDGLEGAY